jgi:hypothetical protein
VRALTPGGGRAQAFYTLMWDPLYAERMMFVELVGEHTEGAVTQVTSSAVSVECAANAPFVQPKEHAESFTETTSFVNHPNAIAVLRRQLLDFLENIDPSAPRDVIEARAARVRRVS